MNILTRIPPENSTERVASIEPTLSGHMKGILIAPNLQAKNTFLSQKVTFPHFTTQEITLKIFESNFFPENILFGNRFGTINLPSLYPESAGFKLATRSNRFSDGKGVSFKLMTH